MKHHISMLISEGQLHLAPIGPNPQLILDIGTGTGKFRSFKNHSGMIADKERHMGY